MPTYEYACKKCGEHLEVVQSFKDDALTKCPNCGGALRKVFGNVGIVFKGSGFYKTDSRPAAKSESAGSASKSDSKKSETKADTKTETSSDSKKSDSKPSDSKPSDSKKDTKKTESTAAAS